MTTARQQHRGLLSGPLPEILGYVGAALLASAALTLIGQSWDDWSPTVHLIVTGSGLIALVAAAGVITVQVGGRAALAERDNLRRLVAVLVALAAPLAAVTTSVLLDVIGVFRPVERADTWMLLVAAVGFTAAALGAALVRGVMTTLAVAAMSAFAAATVMGVLVPEASYLWWEPVIFAVSAALWLALAPRLLAVPVLAESLGVAWLLIGLVPIAMRFIDESPPAEIADSLVLTMWLARALLAAFALVALIHFTRGATWPWAVGGVIAAAVVALSLAGQTLGWIAGLMAAGAVLLAVSGVLLLTRRRREGVDAGVAAATTGVEDG